MTRKKVILIAGPTASGKTALAVSVARKLHTQIISADSRQCFSEMNIGVARPSLQELDAVKHFFIASHSIHDHVNAAVFESFALSAAEEIFRQHDMLVLVGGTGLYIKAFCEGLDDMPPVDTSLREQITAWYKEKGLEWLQKEVSQQDPLYYASGEIHNPQRLMRALEVKLSSGRSIREFQLQQRVNRSFDVARYAIDVPRTELHDRINRRVDAMIDNGLVEEVRSLLPYRYLNALQTVGYSELFEYFDGALSLDAAIERIRINTRHYAKRQMTWFKKDPSITWISNESGIRI